MELENVKDLIKDEKVRVISYENLIAYQCQHCTRSFGIQRKLKSHIQNVHERVKCNECGQEMCNTFILKRHKAKVHGVMPTKVHQCKHCPMFFSGKGSLKNHGIGKCERSDKR